ncbi:MAG: AAA family ATPase [Spirochaetaceae bacterium]|jgi:exonuclease SbcC|nr:AAA family ATPase [Spirochaetaceae bacterium]
MKPLLLTMQNFGPFAGREVVDFRTLDDIFLITGKTGSGKTTIFDALCFALYGKVPGSRGDHLARLKSDYTQAGDECTVSLEFLSGEKHYRVDRSPKREKRKQREKGPDEFAALYEIRQGSIIPLNTKRAETDENIRSLIGLDADEFFKIVLLPQGEFAEFLKQNTAKRREVLGKLFPIEMAARIKDVAAEKANQLNAETREVMRALAEISKRISFDTMDELREQAEAELQEARVKTRALAGKAEKLKNALAMRQNETALRERLLEAEQKAARNGEEAAAIAEKEKRRELSREARPLSRLLNSEAEKKTALLESEAALKEASEEKNEAGQALAAAENRAKETPALEAETRELRERRPAVTEILAEEEKLSRAVKETETLRAKTEALSLETARFREQLAETENEIQKLETAAQKTDEIELRLEDARAVMERLRDLKKIAAEGEISLATEKEAGEAAEKLRAECDELSRRVPVLEEESARLRQEKERHERGDLAAHLALGLRRGEPCPVCGSPEHPLPAPALAPLFGADERIASLEGAARDGRSGLAEKSAEQKSREQEQRRAAAKIRELLAAAAGLKGEIASCGTTGEAGGAYSDTAAEGGAALRLFAGAAGSLPSQAETEELLKAQVQLVNGLLAKQKSVRQAAGRVAELRREQDSRRKASAEKEKEFAALDEKLKNLSATAFETGQKHERVLEDARRTLEGTPDGGAARQQSAADILAAIDRRLAEAEEAIRRNRDEREKAGRVLAAAAAREESLESRRGEARKQYHEAAEALETSLASSPFENAEALRGALADADAEAALEEEINRWKEERSWLASLKTELLRSLDTVQAELRSLGDVPNTEEIKRELSELAAEQEKAEEERDRASGKIAALEQDAQLLRETSGRYEELQQKSRRYTALAKDLRGDNPKKRPFDAWLLGRYLEEVAAFATRRLERMSEGRYSLLLDSGGEKGRAWTGLDLAVFDAYTGKCRPCATLSGGESFMASISLALGLADSIQNRSGGVRLDAVFIDEGFGSLDDATLDLAMTVLDELRAHRMVGLISHVADMRSRISSRIEVIKSGSGSRIRLDSSNIPLQDKEAAL